MAIKELNDFLSTDTRKKVFLYYVFSDIAPSDIVDETKIPFSTVDRITHLLKAHNILSESEGKDMRETKYTIKFDYWVRDNLKFIGLDFLEESELKQITELMKDKKFFALSYLFISPNFILEFFKEPMAIGNDLPLLILMDMNRIENMPAQLPSSMLIYLKFSPLFTKLTEDINSDILDNDIKIINKGIKKYTFSKDMAVDEDDLIQYEKKRTDLILLLRRLFEKKILKMSIEKSE